MSQFRIKGIDYVDDSLQHGLGKGSGRGRPVGSKNGQVMPGAAYMKDYKVVGEKAQGDTNQVQGTRRTSGGANRIDPYGSGGRQQRTGTRVIRTTNARSNNQQQSAGRTRTATGTNRIASGSVITNRGRVISTQDMRTKSTPAATTSKGKDAVTKMMEYNGTQMGSGRTTSNGAYKYDTPIPQQRVVEEAPAQQNNSQLHAPDRQVNKPINGQGKQNDNRIHAPNQASGQQNQNQNQNQTQAQPSDAGRGDNGGIQPDRPVSDAGKGDTDSDRGSEETPEQKSFWDRLGGWFNQAGKDIGNTVSGAWNTATGAINDAAVWVGDRLKDGGEWARSSMGDVGKWIGDRAKDLDHWWNGEDIEVNDNGHWRQGHRDGVREQIGNAANAAGQWIGNAAGDVGKAVGGAFNDAARGLDYWWNGTPYNELDPSTVGFVPGDPNSNPRVGGARRDITSAIGSAGSTIGDAANAVGQWVGNAANDVGTAVDEAWNGKQRTIRRPGPSGNTIIENVREGGIRPGIENAVNAAGQWIGDQANAVGQGVSNFVNGVRPGEAQPYYDVNRGQWVDPTMPSLGERIQGGIDTARQGLSNFGQAAADTATNAWNGLTGAVNNFGQAAADTASNLWNDMKGAVSNGAQTVSNGVTGAVNQVTGNTQEAADAATVRALDAGVPADYVDYWRGMLSSGAISPAQYSQQMNDYIGNPNMTVNNPNLGNVQQPQQGNWFNDSIVTPVANGWNGLTNFVRDTANNATQGVSDLAGNVGQTVTNGAQNLWNGATSALSNAGQAVSNGVTNAYNQVTGNTMENADNATARALNAGIPADYVGQLRDQLTAGQINPAQYVQQIDNLLGNPNMTDPNRR